MDSYYKATKSESLRPILRHKSAAVFIHWCFQSLLLMDATERTWKLLIDVVLAAAIFRWGPKPIARAPRAVIALLAAHTLNFIFNAHLWGVLKHFGGVRSDWATYQTELLRLQKRVAREPHIRLAAAYGSLARAQWSPHSDLDLRLVRGPGPVGAIRVCWFATYERSRAFFRRFPLDIYVLDDPASLAHMAEAACPIILGGSDCRPRYPRE